MPARPEHFADARRSLHFRGADLVFRRIKIDVDEQAGVIEESRDCGGDADRAIRHLQKLRHDEGGRSHHRRHQLSAGGAHGFDRRSLVAGEAGPDHHRDGDDADRKHIGDRAAGDHAEQAGAHDRDLGRAAAIAPHRRACEIGEKIGAAGARQHLPHDGERDHHQHRDRDDRADDAVGIEPEIDDQPLGRDICGWRNRPADSG